MLINHIKCNKLSHFITVIVVVFYFYFYIATEKCNFLSIVISFVRDISLLTYLLFWPKFSSLPVYSVLPFYLKFESNVLCYL